MDLLRATVCSLKPDIVGITESWANQEIFDEELMLDGYRLFQCDRPSPHRGGGVLLYVSSNLNPIEFHTKSTYGEHVWRCVSDLLIGVCYRSTNVNIVGEQNNLNLIEMLNEMSHRHFLLMGDFNFADIDWLAPVPDTSVRPDSKLFLECLDDCFITQHVTNPTRGDAILDLVLTQDPDVVSDVVVGEPLGTSDHNMVLFIVQHYHMVTRNTRSVRDYSRADYASIRSILASINWDTKLVGTTDMCWSHFKTVLQELESKFVPLRKSGRKRSKPKWMSWKAFRLVQ